MVTGTQDVSDREGKKRDLPGLRKARATMSGIQGKGGRQEALRGSTAWTTVCPAVPIVCMGEGP